jgi:hypothetical protein
MAAEIKRTISQFEINWFRSAGANVSGNVISTTRAIARRILKNRFLEALLVARGNLTYTD